MIDEMDLNRISGYGVIVGLALFVSACGDSGTDNADADATTTPVASSEGSADPDAPTDDTAAPTGGPAAGQGTVTVSEGTFTFDITSCIEVQADVQYLIDGTTPQGHTVGLATTGDIGSATFSTVDSAGNPISMWGSQQASVDIDGSLVTVSGAALVVAIDSDETVDDQITVIANFEDCA